uniref:[histone H3]-dimethyl-L-lysine(36) demethylase n=1 Tax=Kwoniella bestiolae CBS 10118 TaxID=1296100 RepID=A0A1B9FYQ8_9TREE|nr:hypothetical protein I302_06881 [Kwoniella bestiolae CBS 10118]OCF23895.1 hypothetical protein I302_06881 [Kwoniella bestiolae CBS 10118]
MSDQNPPTEIIQTGQTDIPDVPVPQQEEQETCPLCKLTGVPQIPGSEPGSDTSSYDVELVWIACSKCDTWYHSACLMLGDEKVRTTIPHEIIQEVEGNRKEEGGAWFNWPQWIDRWYCYTCIARASSPSNPRPPRHPPKATLKKGVPPFESTKPKRPASSASLAQPAKQAKKARTSILNQDGESPRQAKRARSSLSAQIQGSEGVEATQSSNEGRPKRNIKPLDYHNLNNSIATPTNQWLDLIADPGKYGRVILDAKYKSVPGNLLSRSWLDSSSSSSSSSDYPPTLFYGPDREPIIVRPENGGFTSMGGQIPGKDLTVQDVARLVGPKRMVDVIDVSSQQSSQWTLQKWADYLLPPSSSSSSSTRKKVYNIISLEISDTELAKKVKPPKLVREVDWVDNYWNFSISGKGKNKAMETSTLTPTPASDDGTAVNGNRNGEVKAEIVEEDRGDIKENAKAPYPKVQLYCLMGMKGAWTDWHVDFAASSVYYTIHTGSKVFYFIRPTTANLKAYAEWSGSFERQQDTWLPDMCDEVRKVVLNAGDTMIIPAGYIHAVYTPMDSIVFGGNFLHSYDIDTQLRLRQIEIDTKVPQRFRFPMFEKLCWFVAERYNSQLRLLRQYRPRSTVSNPTAPLHSRVLSQLIHLCDFLSNQISILHNPEKEQRSKNLVWDRMPHELIRDPEALVRELRWRVLRELGEGEVHHSSLSVANERNGMKAENGDVNHEKEMKRKKAKLSRVFDKKGGSRTWLFDPPKWEESITPPRIETSLINLPRPFTSKEEEEEAEKTVSTIKQYRTRTREFEGGGLVVEQQEVVFVERKIVWGLDRREGGKMEVD